MVRTAYAAGPLKHVFAALALLLAFALPARTAARSLVPLPRMLLLDGALAGDAVIAVGERGTLLRSTNAGATWQQANQPTPATLTGVAFAPDAEHGWAVGHDAVILATADAGRTWTRQYQGENLEDSFLDVLALSRDHVIAVGAYALFCETSDGGKTWRRRVIVEDDYHFNRIARGPTGTLYLAGEHGTLLRSTNGGRGWTRIPAPYEGSFYGILPLDRRTLLAYGLRGHVYRSTNDGDTWQRVATPDPVLLATAVRLEHDTILLAGHARTLLVSRDLGRSFVAAVEPPATAIAELVQLPNGPVLALGEAGATALGARASRPP